jgi:hypothetical protein
MMQNSPGVRDGEAYRSSPVGLQCPRAFARRGRDASMCCCQVMRMFRVPRFSPSIRPGSDEPRRKEAMEEAMISEQATPHGQGARERKAND